MVYNTTLRGDHMDQYTEILLHMLQNQPAKIEVTFPNLSFRADEIVS